VVVYFWLRPPLQDELAEKHLGDFVELVAGLAANGGHAAVRPRSRWSELKDFALDVEYGARPRRGGPGDFSAGADETADDGQPAAYQQPHRDGGRLPTARHKAFKERRLRGLGVEVKWLGVELPGERPDLLFIDPVRAAQKPSPDPQVFEVEDRFLAVCDGESHDEPLLEGCLSCDSYGTKVPACRAAKSRALVAGLPVTASTSLDAASPAFRVGYESRSQFRREPADVQRHRRARTRLRSRSKFSRRTNMP